MAFALSIVILLIIAYQSESVTFEERRRHWELEDGQRRHNFTEHRHADVNAGNQTWHDGLGVEGE